MNYQRVIFAGNATDNPQRQKAKEGKQGFTTLSVGVGDLKDRTTFFPVIVFGKLGEAVAKYVAKGREVLVDGRLDVNENGRFRVVADRVQFGRGLEPATKSAKKSK